MREKVKPASVADDYLSRQLLCDDPGAWAELRQHLPPEITGPIAKVMAGGADSATIHRLAGLLAAASMPAAAAAAFLLSAETQADPEGRVSAHVEIMRIEQAQGLMDAVAARQRLVRRLVGEGNDGEFLPELRHDGLVVASAFNNPDRHESLRAGLPGPPLADDPLRDPVLTRHLWRGDDGDGSGAAFEDFSFFVVDGRDQPLLLVECDVRGDRYLGCREAGVELTITASGSPELAAAQELALCQLELITAWAGCPHLWLDVADGVALPPAIKQRRGGAVLPFRNGWIDLSQDEAAIEQGYRASTRQRVRWGREHMEVLTQDAPGMDIPALYAALHQTLNRSMAVAPDRLAALLAQGDLRAFAGAYQGELVSLVLTSRHGTTTYDMATMRGIEGKLPLTHILIHAAILDAKAAGQRRFHFGPLYDGGQMGAKMKGIATFKAGFATSFEPRLLLKLGE